MTKLIGFTLFALLMCVLIENGDAHDHKHEKKHKSHLAYAASKGHPLSNRHQYRDEVSGCHCTCPPKNNSGDSDDQGLYLFYEGNQHLVSVVNLTGGASLVIDYFQEIIALFNAEEKNAVLLDSSRLYALNQTKLTWSSNVESYQKFLRTLNLKTLVTKAKKKDKGSDITQPSPATSAVALRILGKLGISSSSDIRIIGYFASTFQRYLNGGLRGLFSGSGHVKIPGNIPHFFNLLSGLNNLFAGVSGGIEQLRKLGINIDPNTIFNATSGPEIFLHILEQLGSRANFANLFGNFLNSSEFLALLINLGGNSTDGINGLFLIVYNIEMAASGNMNVTILIQRLLQITSGPNFNITGVDFRDIFGRILRIVQQQGTAFNTSEQLGPLTNYLRNLTSGSLVQNGVNISTIIERITNTSGGVNIISEIIKQFANLPQNVPKFVLQFATFLRNSTDPGSIRRLLPDLPLDLLGENGNLWTNFLQIIQGGLANAAPIVENIPIIGTFYRVFYEQFKRFATSGLADVLSPSFVLKTFQNVFNGFLNLTHLANIGQDIANQAEDGFNHIIGGIGSFNTGGSSGNGSSQTGAGAASVGPSSGNPTPAAPTEGEGSETSAAPSGDQSSDAPSDEDRKKVRSHAHKRNKRPQYT